MAIYETEDGQKFEIDGDNHTPDQIRQAAMYIQKQGSSPPSKGAEGQVEDLQKKLLSQNQPSPDLKPPIVQPIQPPQTVAGKASNLVSSAVQPFIKPDITLPFTNRPVQFAEQAGKNIKGEVQSVISDSMSSPSSVNSDLGLKAKALGGMVASLGVDAAPFTPSEFALNAGAEMAGAPVIQKVGSGLDNVLGIPTIKSRAVQGFQDFAKSVGQSFGATKEPTVAGEAIKKTLGVVLKNQGQTAAKLEAPLNEFKDVPAATASDAAEYIDTVLNKRGMAYSKSKDALRAKLLQDSDLSSKDVAEIAQQLAEAKAPKITAKLKTPSVSEYAKLSDVMDDLSRRDLTYGDMRQMRTTIGDYANFGSKDRGPVEKLYGGLYNSLGNDLERTAKAGGFLPQHKEYDQFFTQFKKFEQSPTVRGVKFKNPEDLVDFVAGPKAATESKTIMGAFDNKGQNYIRRGVLDKILSQSRVFTPSGEKVTPEGIASSLNQYSDEQINNLFGEDSKLIYALRDISNTESGGALKTGAVEDATKPLIYKHSFSGISGIKNLIKKYNLPANLSQILERRLGTSETAGTILPQTGFMGGRVRPGLATAGGQSLRLPITTGNENR